MSELVACDVVDGVAYVRLDRPDKLNALTLPMLGSLAEVAHGLRRDRSLRAVVLSGEGDSFCAGLDFASALAEPRRLAASFVPRPWRGTNTFQEACFAWRSVPVPVIAAVRGHCYGGGLQIALGADLRIATPDSQWSVMEARWGLVPDMGGVQALSELVGIDVAKRLTMTAEVIDGHEASRLGLATEVAADPHVRTQELVEQMRRHSPDQLAATKRLFHGTWRRSARRTLAAERLEQLALLRTANTAIARRAAFGRRSERPDAPEFRPRRHRARPSGN